MSMICPQCNTENADNSNFCMKCGYTFPKIKHCVKCGAMLPLNSKFCAKCGTQSISQSSQRVPSHGETEIVSNVRQPRQPNNKKTVKPRRQQRVPTRSSQQPGLSSGGNKTLVLTIISIVCLAVIGGAVWWFFEIQKSSKLDAFVSDFVRYAQNNDISALKSVYPDIVFADSVAIPGVYGKPIIEEGENKGNYTIRLSPDVSITVRTTSEDKFQVTESRGLFAFDAKNMELLRQSADWSSGLDDVRRAELLKSEFDKRINFTSPDLSLFNLHGPVKELAVSYTGIRDGGTSLFEHLSDSKIYRFTEDGEWCHDFYQVKRNSNGYITKVYTDSEAYYDPYGNHWFVGDFSWNGKTLRSFELYPVSTEFSYKDGKISEISTGWVQSMIASDGIKLSKFQYDEFGNWISCNWKEKVIIDYDSIPETKIYTGTMKRRIEYY